MVACVEDWLETRKWPAILRSSSWGLEFPESSYCPALCKLRGFHLARHKRAASVNERSNTNPNVQNLEFRVEYARIPSIGATRKGTPTLGNSPNQLARAWNEGAVPGPWEYRV